MTRSPLAPDPGSQGFSCRVATLDDAPDMLQVIQSAFASWPPLEIACAPLDHLRWKMESHPRAAETHLVVEHRDDEASRPRMVGVALRLLSDVSLRGQPLVSKLGADNAVLPGWQGRGISWIWEDYSADHFDGRLWDLDLGFRPRHAASRHRAAKLGPTVVANPVVGFYRGFEARQFAAVHGRTAGPRHFVAATLRYLRWRVQRPREVPPSPGLWVRRIERFDDRVTRLATSALSEFDFSFGRSARHLNWRHADPRGGHSTLLAAEQRDELWGYAVMRSGARIAQLADILIDPHHPEALAPLLRATVDAARESGLGGIQAWLPRRHPYRTALIQQGFLETGLNAHCQYIANNAPPALDQVLTDPGAALHITSADTDWV